MAVLPATFGRGFQAPGQRLRQRTPFLFVNHQPKTNSRTQELHCLQEDHQTLFDSICQEIPKHNPTNKTWNVFHCTKLNLTQIKTSLDPTKRTVLSVKPNRVSHYHFYTPCSPEASVDKSRCIYSNVAPAYDNNTI